ncbi:MAG: NUDIX domain-containing protein [Chlamydiota bacterium]
MIEKHFTVTTYVIDKKKVLLIFHPKHNKWLPPGGHLEPNETPPEGALREVLEETGLEVEIIKQENLWINCRNAVSFERPYLCLLENIPPHNSHPAHQHIDLIYLARPTGNGTLHDSHSARWFSLDEALRLETDVETFGDIKQTIQHLLTVF